MLGGRRVGMGQYMTGLLQSMAVADRSERYLVFALGPRRRLDDAPVISPNVGYRVRRFPRRVHDKLLMADLAPPTELLLGRRMDVCIWPNFVSWPTLRATRNVVIVHDLGFLLHGEYLSECDRSYYRRLVPRSIRRADRVVAVSANVRSELVERFALREEEVTVISPAVDMTRFRPSSEGDVRLAAERYGLDPPYILYTGTLEPRKNIVGVLDAYAELPVELRERYQLVLAGGKGWLDSRIRERLEELADLRIRATGYVPDADLPAIYGGASLFVYPSFYEGFGMPPLEAMACGVPVITSDRSSLPEVVGDAAIKVSPTDAPALAEAIELVLRDTVRAASMRELGLQQAQRFTWEHSADRLSSLTSELLVASR